MSRWGLAGLTAAGAALVHAFGLVTVLLFPVLLLAWVARMALGAYQALNILIDLGLGAAILVFLVAEDRFRRLFSKGYVRTELKARWMHTTSNRSKRRTCVHLMPPPSNDTRPTHNTTQRCSVSPLRARLQAAESYAEYRKLCAEVDRVEGTQAWREEEKDLPQAVLLRRTIEELEAALGAGNLPQLKFLLGGVFRVGVFVS